MYHPCLNINLYETLELRYLALDINVKLGITWDDFIQLPYAEALRHLDVAEKAMTIRKKQENDAVSNIVNGKDKK